MSTPLTDDRIHAEVQARYAASARAHLGAGAAADPRPAAATGSPTDATAGADASASPADATVLTAAGAEPAERTATGCCSSAAPGCCADAPASAGACCTPEKTASGCCTPSASPASGPTDPISGNLYDPADTPFDAALAASLGCGNPTALAQLHPGQDVLDLGSGGGLDVLLSARRVAPGGTAYGLDMTPEMLALAERNRAEAGIDNARFLLGQIEQIPLPDASVDVVISNCVINLSPDKDAVLREAHRVLRPQGRFAVSDIVLLRDIPAELGAVVGLWTGCIAGALRDVAYVDKLTAAGFVEAGVEVTRSFERAELETLAEELDLSQLPAGMTLAQAIDALDGAFASAFVRARKPGAIG